MKKGRIKRELKSSLFLIKKIICYLLIIALSIIGLIDLITLIKGFINGWL